MFQENEIGLFPSFFSEDDISTILKYWEKDSPRKAVMHIRELWQKNADIQFLKNFTFIHWNTLPKLESIIKKEKYNEICCQAYLSPPYNCGHMGGVGLGMIGYPFLAGNLDLLTNEFLDITLFNGKRYTRHANQLLFNQETCITPFEFVIGKWHPIYAVFDSSYKKKDMIKSKQDMEYFLKLTDRLNLPILNQYGEFLSKNKLKLQINL